MMLDVRPGDWVELRNGRRGTVLTVCSVFGIPCALEVGFDWFDIADIVAWKPQD